MTGRRVDSKSDVRQAGDWCLDVEPYEGAKEQGVALFYYRAPDGTLNCVQDEEGWPSCDSIFVRTGAKQRGYWQWDGNVEAPTFAPSIFHKGQSSWHGFFRGGNWVTA